MKKNIPNPNKLSAEELTFIQDPDHIKNLQQEPKTEEKNLFKGRPISMSDAFYKELNRFLKENPTEGNRSGFVVRVVAEYIKSKT